MLPLNFNHLYYFYVVSKHGSFSDAARELAVSQSAVSVQMKQFEASLGATLFDRRKTGVELTSAGEIVYEHAEEMFQNVDGLRDRLEAAEHHMTGTIGISTVNSVGTYVLPDLLKQFKGEYPEVKVTIDFRQQRGIVDRVRSGAVDFGILTFNRKLSGLTAVPLRRSKVFLVAPADHPLSGRGDISPRDLEEFPFIAYEEGMDTRMMMDSLFKRMSLRVEYSIESSDVATVMHMVLAGLGLAFLPETVAGREIRQGQIVRLDVPSLAMAQEITVYHKTNRTLTPTKREFLSFLKNALAVRRRVKR